MNPTHIERLESRTLLADTMVSIQPRSNASETDPAGAGLGQFTLRRTGDASGILDVNLRFSPGSSTATPGNDLSRPATKVRLGRGRDHVHFNVVPIDDSVAEPTETIVMKIFSGEYQISPTRPSARIALIDNETTVGIFATKPEASEDDPTGAGIGQFRVSRIGPTDRALEVRYYTRANSTAVNNQDFERLSGTVTIPAGERNVFFDLVPIDDDRNEGPETVFLTVRPNRAYAIGHHSAGVTIADNDESIAGWWDDRWEFRSPINVNVGSQARTDKPVDRQINFTEILGGLGRSGSLILNSIRVIETSEDGLTVIDDDVPFQFDRSSDFNAGSNAAGNLVFIMTGTTDANATRHYHVYFDTQGSFAPANVSPHISTTDNVLDENLSTIRVATPAGTYFYHKDGGGFTSLVDSEGNDWVGYNSNSDPGSAGIFRGIPNLPEQFHPGNMDVTTTIVSRGPLKTTIESSADEGARRIRWEIYPTYARATVLAYNANYWFLYEGTPGGSMDANDFVVRSDGTRTDITESWEDSDGIGSDNGQEWAYFNDEGLERFLFLAHDEADDLEDSYFNLDGNMTVFGFGRHNNPGAGPDALLTAAPNSFTIGLRDGGAFDPAAATINAAYRSVDASLAGGQTRTGE